MDKVHHLIQLKVIIIGLTWAFTWWLKTASASCWGSFVWLKQLHVVKLFCPKNLSKITSKGATCDLCVHKCFSLELSWLWLVLWWTLPNKSGKVRIWNQQMLSNIETFIHQKISLSLFREISFQFIFTNLHNFVCSIALTIALTWVWKAASGIC